MVLIIALIPRVIKVSGTGAVALGEAGISYFSLF